MFKIGEEKVISNAYTADENGEGVSLRMPTVLGVGTTCLAAS